MSQIIFTKDIHESIIRIAEELHTMNNLKEKEIKIQEQILERLKNPNGYKIK